MGAGFCGMYFSLNRIKSSLPAFFVLTMEQKQHQPFGKWVTFILCCIWFNLNANPTIPITLTEATFVTPNIIRVPFRLTGTLITVRARTDTTEGNFFFDTGASGLVLNSRVYGDNLIRGAQGAGSVTGAVQIKGQKTIDSFQMDNMLVREIRADLVDLSHIELAKKTAVNGLIGFEVFSDFEILLDYSSSLIMLIRINNKGIPIEPIPTWEYQVKGSFALEVSGHIAFVRLKFGKKNKWFGLDTGAEQNLLNHLAGKRFLKDNFEVRKRVKLRGASRESIEVLTGILMNTQLDTFTFSPMATILTNLDEINATYRTNLDGIVGYEFFSQQIMSINIKRKRLTFYEPGPRP